MFQRNTITLLALFFGGCANDVNTLTPAQDTTGITIKDLPADPATYYDPTNGTPVGVTGKFTFFSFATGKVILNTDSATTKWDIAFRGTTILFNSGSSGPGKAGVIIQKNTFENVTTLPTTGYGIDSPGSPAVPTGSGRGWYIVSGQPTIVIPIPGILFFIKTNDEKYVKMEIISYYKGAPANPQNPNEARYYTFRYL
ncbi:MAG: HmuY family protein [Chitinophagaceae bacterium]|nr:HmuY family protein [Chitinophagaceae bacterium]